MDSWHSMIAIGVRRALRANRCSMGLSRKRRGLGYVTRSALAAALGAAWMGCAAGGSKDPAGVEGAPGGGSAGTPAQPGAPAFPMGEFPAGNDFGPIGP